MATNIVFEDGNQLSLACTDPATPAANDPVLIGKIPAVALTAERTDGTTTVKRNGTATFSVKGVTTGAAGSAVAVGDEIFYVPGNTPKLSKASGDSGAVHFGWALGTVGSGSTASIDVAIGY